MLFSKKKNKDGSISLNKAKVGETFDVLRIDGNEKTRKFLLTLGCYEGEAVTIISKLAGNFVINIKDSRYAIDTNLAKSIVIKA